MTKSKGKKKPLFHWLGGSKHGMPKASSNPVLSESSGVTSPGATPTSPLHDHGQSKEKVPEGIPQFNSDPCLPYTPLDVMRTPKLPRKSANSPHGSPLRLKANYSSSSLLLDVGVDLSENDYLQFLGGRYDVGKTIGQGTHGKVKKAVHRLSQMPVALKIIKRSSLHDDPERFSEIKALTLLHHPNIVAMYNTIETPDAIVQVLEMMEGGELFDFIVARGKLAEKEAKKFVIQILNAIAYCHDNNVVHRDLKLENILLDKDRNIKIADFGFANIFKNDTLMTTYVGSPAYTSPEIMATDPYIGPASDVWSIGVIIYTLIAGAQPFKNSENFNDFFDTVQQVKYEIPDHLSSEAKDIITSIFKKDPTLRPSVKNLLNHPWFADLEESKNSNSPEPSFINIDFIKENPLNEKVLNELLSHGLLSQGQDISDLKENLISGKNTAETEAYILLSIRNQIADKNDSENEEIELLAQKLASIKNQVKSGGSPANIASASPVFRAEARGRARASTINDSSFGKAKPKRTLFKQRQIEPICPNTIATSRKDTMTATPSAASTIKRTITMAQKPIFMSNPVCSASSGLNPKNSPSPTDVRKESKSSTTSELLLSKKQEKLLLQEEVRKKQEEIRRQQDEEEDIYATKHQVRIKADEGLFTASTTSSKSFEYMLKEIKRACTSLGIKCSLTQENTYTCVFERNKNTFQLGPQEKERVVLQLKVCQLQNILLNGIRFRRLNGNIWTYKLVCEKIIKRLRL